VKILGSVKITPFNTKLLWNQNTR